MLLSKKTVNRVGSNAARIFSDEGYSVDFVDLSYGRSMSSYKDLIFFAVGASQFVHPRSEATERQASAETMPS